MNTSARISEFPIEPLILNRWSPRAMSGEAVTQNQLKSLFEAARWAPSANNAQPWRFVYAFKGTAHWQPLFSLLNEGNQAWAKNASALVFVVSNQLHQRKGSSEPTLLRSHSFDSGAAWAYFALQAQANGLLTHAIGGFDRERARTVLNSPEGYQIEVAIAVGKPGDADTLSEELRAREKPNSRNPQSEWVHEGHF